LALARLERNYPTAGIIVATRTHHITPPLPGSSRVKLLLLSRAQRADYLRQSLGSQADELRLQLDGSRVLDDLCRTPLILSEVTTLSKSGVPIPSTKVGVLSAVMQLVDGADDHRAHLQRPPLMGRASDYLAELAVQMTRQGDVRILEEEARVVCHAVSSRLKDGGQIATLPEPASVLNTLCAHHVLERLDYPSIAFRFEHQQFQEFYATSTLRRELWDVVAEGKPEKASGFAEQYVNWPIWEEPLRMVAEGIATRSTDPAVEAEALQAGRQLVEMALPIDPIFAAELSRLCGAAVWQEIRGKVGACLRTWYGIGNEHHRHCALAGMLASGADEFGDVLLPLLTSDDQQVRLRTYRTWGEFHPSSLGPDWRRIVGGWGEDQRIDFIFEIMRNRWIAELSESFPLADPSPRVRNEALRRLSWYGADDTLARHLKALDDDGFEDALHKLSVEDVPVVLRSRAIAAYRKRLRDAGEVVVHLRLLLAMAAWGDTTAAAGIKVELARLPPGRIYNHTEPVLKSVLEIVGTVEPGWVSDWVTARIVDGSLWSDPWINFVSSVPEALQTEFVARVGSERLQYNDVSRSAAVLVKAADPTIGANVISRLCDIRKTISEAPDPRRAVEWEILHQLKRLFKALPPIAAVTGLLERIGGRLDPIEFTVAIDVLGEVGPEQPNLRGDFPEPLRQKLRAYLISGLPFILSEDDFAGELKMHLAVALGRVGDPEDMADLEQLIQADIERLRKHTKGARMVCANWHVNALTRLSPQAAEAVLLKLLGEPEYQGAAGNGLIHLARNQPEGWAGQRAPDYRKIWEARAGRHASGFDDDRRRRYATAINSRINDLLEERRASDKPDSLNGRLKGLAAMVARLDGRNSAARVLEIMALPGEWDGWTRTEALDMLLFSGATLPTDATLKALNPTIDHMLAKGSIPNKISAS